MDKRYQPVKRPVGSAATGANRNKSTATGMKQSAFKPIGQKVEDPYAQKGKVKPN